jgi:hypothetical protein
MAKTLTKPDDLPPLAEIQRKVMAHVLNSVAFTNYDECCTVTNMATLLRRTPRGLLTTLRKLEEKGCVTIRGGAQQRVFPPRRPAPSGRSFLGARGPVAKRRQLNKAGQRVNHAAGTTRGEIARAPVC